MPFELIVVVALHIIYHHLYIFYLADAFIQSDLQLIRLSMGTITSGAMQG